MYYKVKNINQGNYIQDRSISIYDFFLENLDIFTNEIAPYGIVGDPKTSILYFDSLFSDCRNSCYGSICYIYPTKDIKDNIVEYVYNIKASLVILDISLNYLVPKTNQCFIFCKNPKYTFVKLLMKYSEKCDNYDDLIITHAQATAMYPNVYIGPNVIIERGAIIGAGSILIGNNYIGNNVAIGKNVVVKPNSVIGKSGYWVIPDYDGNLSNYPTFGGVIINDNVMIGSCVCIDCGIIDNTIIGAGVKIDNLVHIAHDVVIGENSMIIANVMIAGYVTIGKNVRLAPSSCIREKINIGNDVVVGLGSVVVKDVQSNKIVYGVPAKEKI